MKKYFVFMLLIAGIALIYVFNSDPCNRQVREDFSNKYPSYKILKSIASHGSPEKVHCHISFQKSGSDQVLEGVWLYMRAENGYEFAKVLETTKTEQAQ